MDQHAYEFAARGHCMKEIKLYCLFSKIHPIITVLLTFYTLSIRDKLKGVLVCSIYIVRITKCGLEFY